MAITVTPDLTLISDCENITEWVPEPDLDGDFKIQGSNCMAAQVKATLSSIYEYIFGSAQDMTGKHIYVWMMIAGVADTKANGGYRIYVETDANNYGTWYVGGGDEIPTASHPGGWGCYVIDPASTPNDGTGTVNPASITKIGVQFKTLSSVVGQANNCFWDICRYGKGLTITSGITDQIGFEDIFNEDNLSANKYGVITKGSGTYIIQGLLTFGGTGAENIDFIDKSQVVIFPTNEFASDSFYGIKVQCGTGTTNFTLGEQADTSGVIGCLLKAAGTKTFSFDVSDADNDKILLYGSSFINAGTITLPSNADNREVVNCAFEVCAEVLADTCIVQYCNFISADDRAVRMSSTSHHITDCNFIGCPKAIHIDVAGTYEFNALKFIGNTYDIENSTVGGDVYIDRTNDSDPSSEKLLNSGAPPGTITINPLSVYLTIWVKDEANVAVGEASVAIYKSADDTQLMNELSDVDGKAQEAFQYTDDIDIYIRVRKSSSGTRYFPLKTTGTITSTGFTLTAVLIEDEIVSP